MLLFQSNHLQSKGFEYTIIKHKQPKGFIKMKLTIKTNDLQSFVSYLTASGFETRPPKGVGQFIQIKFGKDWMSIYQTKDCTIHTVDSRLESVVKGFEYAKAFNPNATIKANPTLESINAKIELSEIKSAQMEEAIVFMAGLISGFLLTSLLWAMVF